MSGQMVELIRLIKENKTLNEISEITGLSNKQLFTKLSMLRQSGYLFDRQYYDTGDIRYQIANPLENEEKTNEVFINLTQNTNHIRAVLTSDNHLGNHKDNLRCADLTMNYCVKNGIHLNFNTGDLFEGVYPFDKPEVKYNDAEEQIRYGLKNYPYDKNVLTFICLGNHDIKFYLEEGIDIKSILMDRRHDLVPVGYGYGKINIGDYFVVMQHRINNKSCKVSMPLIRGLLLSGHSHNFKINTYSNGLFVNVPSSSKVKNSNGTFCPIPSIIDMTLIIKGDNIAEEHFKQYIFLNNKLIKMGELTYHVLIHKNASKKFNIKVLQKENT